MENIKWELMQPSDIELRPAATKDGKTTLVLYQNSRNTMEALDRNFGAFGWTITYKDVGGKTYGCLSIKNPNTGEWISKEDTGDESNISAQKGQSSDILKRCAVRFGYGRELYSAPRIVIDDDGYGNTGYKVNSITYNDNREITSLSISNRFGKEVFNWNTTVTQPTPYTETNTNSKLDTLKTFCSTKKTEAGVNKKELLKFWEHYSVRVANWRGDFNAEALYNRWMLNK